MYYLPHQESLETLTNMSISKSEIFKDMNISFDYTLPQGWLNRIARLPGAPSYDVILSTTVWAYPPGQFMGIPITACIEVQQAINKLNKQQEIRHHVYV